MADSVYIDGFSQDAISQLPEWATESTLSSILKTLQANSKMQDTHFQKLENALRKFTGVKGPSGSTTTLDPKLMGQLNDELRDSLQFAEQEATQHKKTKKQWAETNKQHTLGEALFGKLTKSAAGFNTILGGIDVLAAKGIAAMKENVNGYTNLYRAGVGVIDASNGISDGFQSLEHLVLLSGIRLSDLNTIMTKYSTTVTVYGTQKFVKAATLAQKSLQGLGYSAIEGLEFTASYLDAIKGFSDTANLSEQQIAKSAVKFGSSMRDLSLLTGQSTQELMSKFKDLAKSTDAFILTSQVGGEASKNMLAFAAGLKDQNLAKQLLATVTAPIKEIDSTVNALLSSGQGAIAQQYKDVAGKLKAASENGASPEQLSEIYRQFGANMRVSAAQIQNLQLQGTEQSKAALSIIMSAQQAARDSKPLTAARLDEIKKETESQQARNRIADQWNSIIAKFVALFTPSTAMLNFFGDALGVVSSSMSWVADKFEGSIIPSVLAIAGALTGGVASILVAFAKFKSVFSFTKSVKEAPVEQNGLMSKIGQSISSGASKIWAWMSTALQDIGSKMGAMFSRIWELITLPFEGLGTKIWGSISSLFKSASTGIIETVTTWLGRIFSIFDPFMGIISKLGGLFMRFAGVVGLLYTAFEGGYAIGTWLHNLIKDFDLFQKGMDGLFSFIDHLLQYVPGQIGKDAKERIATQDNLAKINTEKSASVAATPTTKTAIQPIQPVTEPTRSVIRSVSAAEPTNKDQQEPEKLSTASDNQSIAKTPPTAKEPEINSILKYQTSLLEQLLDKESDILSTNRELLKITRNT